MLIKELKEKLNEYPDDMEAVIASTWWGVSGGPPAPGPIETSVNGSILLQEAVVKAELGGEEPCYFFGNSWGETMNHPDLVDRRVLMIS